MDVFITYFMLFLFISIMYVCVFHSFMCMLKFFITMLPIAVAVHWILLLAPCPFITCLLSSSWSWWYNGCWCDNHSHTLSPHLHLAGCHLIVATCVWLHLLVEHESCC